MYSAVSQQCAVTAAVFHDVEAVSRAEMSRNGGREYEYPEVRVRVAKAEAEAARIIAEARTQADAIRQEAWNSGVSQGLHEGGLAAQGAADRELETGLSELQGALAEITDKVEAERRRTLEAVEGQVLDLVMEIAAKVIKDEALVNPKVAEAVVRSTLRRVAESDVLRVRVNGADLEHLQSQRANISRILGGAKHIEFVDDRRVGAGGCIVEASDGTIDARIDMQLDIVGSTFVNADGLAA